MPDKIELKNKIDLKKRHKPLFTARAVPALIDVPALSYLMVDGAGMPGNGEFEPAVTALYSTAYTIKFAIKKTQSGPDYVVAPLEALWWSDDGDPVDPIARPRAVRWTAMVMQPDFVTAHDVGAGIAAAKAKLAGTTGPENPALDRIILDRLAEGRAAQLLQPDPIPSKVPASNGCTPSSPPRDWRHAASTTRSTSTIPAVPRRRNSKRSCANRWARLTGEQRPCRCIAGFAIASRAFMLTGVHASSKRGQ